MNEEDIHKCGCLLALGGKMFLYKCKVYLLIYV
jgi:hypothetical protein